jgi:hypothetical protein
MIERIEGLINFGSGWFDASADIYDQFSNFGIGTLALWLSALGEFDSLPSGDTALLQKLQLDLTF